MKLPNASVCRNSPLALGLKPERTPTDTLSASSADWPDVQTRRTSRNMHPTLNFCPNLITRPRKSPVPPSPLSVSTERVNNSFHNASQKKQKSLSCVEPTVLSDFRPNQGHDDNNQHSTHSSCDDGENRTEPVSDQSRSKSC